MEIITKLKELGIQFSPGILPVIIVMLYLFKNPEKFEHWMKIFYSVLYYLSSGFPKIKRRIDRRLVAASIQDSVNGICNQINDESPNSLPHALKIEWLKSDTADSFISKGEAMIRLKYYDNQDRNIVESTLLYLKKAFLPRAKNYLDKTMKESCEFKIASKVFISKPDTGAYDYFVQEQLDPAISTNKEIARDLQVIEDLDSVGIFTRVFLTEVTITGEKLLGTAPTPTVRRELRDFAYFLRIIAMKGKNEKVPLTFKGVKIRAAVILVARPETIFLHGIRPYVNRVAICLREGYESVYLAGWGDEFINGVLMIKNEIEKNMVTVLRRYDYQVEHRTKAVLLVCYPKSSYLARQRELQDQLRQVMNDVVPEIKAGIVKIVSIARMPGVGSKVAVASEQPEEIDAKYCCIGKNGERIKILKERFPNEFVSIVPWPDSPKQQVINSIAPLNPRYVDCVEFDEENLIATVKVLNDEQIKKAIGKAGHNVKLASELSGWLINIEPAAKQKAGISPEEELKEVIRKEIPEILNNEIEIVQMARIEGFGSKVIVRWKENMHSSKRASEICYGIDHDNLRRIRDQVSGELVYFHDWFDKPEMQIGVCLYPLKREAIKVIEIDEFSKLAVITLDLQKTVDGPKLSDDNIALCEEVTGYKIEILHST